MYLYVIYAQLYQKRQRKIFESTKSEKKGMKRGFTLANDSSFLLSCFTVYPFSYFIRLVALYNVT